MGDGGPTAEAPEATSAEEREAEKEEPIGEELVVAEAEDDVAPPEEASEEAPLSRSGARKKGKANMVREYMGPSRKGGQPRQGHGKPHPGNRHSGSNAQLRSRRSAERDEFLPARRPQCHSVRKITCPGCEPPHNIGILHHVICRQHWDGCATRICMQCSQQFSGYCPLCWNTREDRRRRAEGGSSREPRACEGRRDRPRSRTPIRRSSTRPQSPHRERSAWRDPAEQRAGPSDRDERQEPRDMRGRDGGFSDLPTEQEMYRRLSLNLIWMHEDYRAGQGR